MEEDKLLKELRAQRELIRKHLEWLDAKITEQEGSEKDATGGPRSIVAAISEENKGIPSDPKAREAKSPTTTKEGASTPVSNDEEDADETFGTYKAPTGNEVLRAKIGCFVLFVLSIVLFLFLLFGLPYLLD